MKTKQNQQGKNEGCELQRLRCYLQYSRRTVKVQFLKYIYIYILV